MRTIDHEHLKRAVHPGQIRIVRESLDKSDLLRAILS
jgi:hypothetical protein